MVLGELCEKIIWPKKSYDSQLQECGLSNDYLCRGFNLWQWSSHMHMFRIVVIHYGLSLHGAVCNAMVVAEERLLSWNPIAVKILLTISLISSGLFKAKTS